MKKSIFFIVLFFFIVIVSISTSSVELFNSSEMKIIDCSKRPSFETGMIAQEIRLIVVDNYGRKEIYYMPYVIDIPQIGDFYIFVYCYGNVNMWFDEDGGEFFCLGNSDNMKIFPREGESFYYELRNVRIIKKAYRRVI